MSNSRRGGQLPLARSNPQPSSERLRSDCIEIDDLANCPEKVPSDFFIPSFSVFRPLLATEEMKDFHAHLRDVLDRRTYKPLPLARMGVRIVEQKALIRSFRDAGVKPYAEDIHDVVDAIKNGLKSQIKSKPHYMTMDTDSVYRFGEDGKSIALGSKGWKGFRARYPRRDSEGKYLFNSQAVNEANLAIGALVNTFSNEINQEGDYTEVDMRPLTALAPHLTVAKKIRGKALSNNEVVELNGVIGEILPPSIPLFDPMIRVRLDREGSGSYVNSFNETEQYQDTLYVRNPKLKEYGHLLLRNKPHESLTEHTE